MTETGVLFAAFFNYYEKNIGETSFFWLPFSSLHIGQKIHLCILLLLYIENVTCPSLWKGTSTFTYDDVIVSTTDFIKTAQAELVAPREKAAKLKKEIDIFCQKKYAASYSDTRDDFSLFTHKWNHIEEELGSLEQKMKVNKLNDTIKDELTSGIESIRHMVRTARDTLSNFHANQKLF